MDEAQLRDSLRIFGALLPVITSGGVLIDGAKRQRLSRDVGRDTRILELYPDDATRALWLVHPERAIARAGKLSIDEYAWRFGVRTLDVAKFLNAQRSNAPLIDPDELGKASTLVQTWWPPRLRYVAGIAARERGMNLSAFTREAVATLAARVLDVNAYELASTPLSGHASGKQHPRSPRTVPGVEHRASRKR